MTPTAITKAEGLARYVKHTGASQSEFVLALTNGEAFELLDYLASGAMGHYAHQSQLQIDVEAAKQRSDPWEVLSAWTLLGFEIVRTMDLH